MNGSDASCGSGLRSVLNIKGRKGSPHSAGWSFLFLLQVPNWFFIDDALLVYVQEPVGMASGTLWMLPP